MFKQGFKFMSIAVATAILVGCGGGGSSSTPSQNTPNTAPSAKSGKVTDGYIAAAQVLVDINTTAPAHKGFPNIDSGDGNYTTDSDGNFEIPADLNVPIGTFVYAKGGKLVSTGEDFNGTLRGVYSGENSMVLSPLSTMVAAQVEKSGSVDKSAIDSAKEKVAKALGVPKEAVTADPVTNHETFKATQKVMAIAKVLSAKSDGNVTNVIEDIAKKIEINDTNLTKAVTEAAGDDTSAKEAIATAKKVEEVIVKLKDKNIDDASAVENFVSQEVVDKATKAAKNDENVSAVLSSVDTDSMVDVVKAASCLTFEKIKGSNSSSTEVTSNLDLNVSSCEENNVTIAWINHSTNINLTTGAVTRENYEDKVGNVEANISKGSKSLTKPIFMTIKAKGHKPVLKDAIIKTDEDTPYTIDISKYYQDKDGDDLNITSITTPAHGTATKEGDKIKYSPESNFNGIDNFVYTVTDPLGAEVNATVRVTVIGINDAPVLSSVTLPSINEDSNTTTIQLSATDADEDNVTFSATSSNTAIAEVSVSGDTLTITPKPNAFGDVDITITASDGKGGTDSKTVTLTINPVNDAPIANDDNFPSIQSSNPGEILDVLKNDTDADGDNLTIKSVTTPNSGTATIISNKIKYIPEADFNGTVTFSYTVTDGKATDSATVTFEVAQYVSSMTKAMDSVKNYDPENDNLGDLLNNVENILNNAPSSEKDAQVGLALVQLVQTLNTELADLIDVSGSNFGNEDTIIGKLLKGKDISTDLSSAISDLSDSLGTASNNIITKLNALASKLDNLYQDPNYVFHYKNFELNANDAKALSALIKLEVAKLEYISAYNIVKKEYVETKTFDLNGTTYEYRTIKADPVTVFNDPTTLSLRGDAQTHLSASKTAILEALTKLLAFNKAQSNLGFANKIDKDLLAKVKASIENGTLLERGDAGDKKIYLDLSKLFNENTALTLANTLGHNFEYNSYENAQYNATLSKIFNKPMGLASFNDNGQHISYPAQLEFKPDNLPTPNTLTGLIAKVVQNGHEYTGNDVLKSIFGEFDIKERYSDSNITYKIIDGIAGDTGPYSCNLVKAKLINFDNGYSEIDTNVILLTTIPNSNNKEYVVNIDTGNYGSYEFEIECHDNYGHSTYRYGWLNIEQQNGAGNGTNPGDGNNTGGSQSGDNNGTTSDFPFNSQPISQNEFDGAAGQPFNVPTMYSVRMNGSGIEYKKTVVDSTNQTATKYKYNFNSQNWDMAGNASYNLNGNVFELDFNGDSVVDLKLKYVAQLSSTELNAIVGDNSAFSSGDIAYVFYSYASGDSAAEYEKQIFFNDSAAQKIVNYLMSQQGGNGGGNQVTLPQGYDYGVINNQGDEVSTSVEYNGNNYTIKLFSNEQVVKDDMANHKGVVVNVNGQSTPTMNIQQDYVSKSIIAAIYDNNDNLVAVSDPITIRDVSVNIIDMNL